MCVDLVSMTTARLVCETVQLNNTLNSVLTRDCLYSFYDDGMSHTLHRLCYTTCSVTSSNGFLSSTHQSTHSYAGALQSITSPNAFLPSSNKNTQPRACAH